MCHVPCTMYSVLLFKPFFFLFFSFVEIMKLASEEASAAYDLPLQNGIPDLQSLISPQVRALPPPPNVVGAVAAPEVQEMPVVPVGLPSVLPSAMGVLPSPPAPPPVLPPVSQVLPQQREPLVERVLPQQRAETAHALHARAVSEVSLVIVCLL